MKPNSFTKLYVHYVFTPKGRECLLNDNVMENVQKYIYGIVKAKKCNPIAINGTRDHIHILLGLSPSLAVNDLIRDIKRSSSLFINENRLVFPHRFNWQEGYGAFTVGYKDLDIVYKYVLYQKEHHSKQNFREEYNRMLSEEGFDNYQDYLFEFYD